MAEVAQAASTHRQHQVLTCHNVQTPAIEPVYRSNHGSIEGPGLAAVCEGRANTQTRYSRSFVVRDSRWSVLAYGKSAVWYRHLADK